MRCCIFSAILQPSDSYCRCPNLPCTSKHTHIFRIRQREKNRKQFMYQVNDHRTRQTGEIERERVSHRVLKCISKYNGLYALNMFQIVLTKNESDNSGKMIFTCYYCLEKRWFQSNRFPFTVFSLCVWISLHPILRSPSLSLSLNVICLRLICAWFTRATPKETSLIYWDSLLSQNIQLHFRVVAIFLVFHWATNPVVVSE